MASKVILTLRRFSKGFASFSFHHVHETVVCKFDLVICGHGLLTFKEVVPCTHNQLAQKQYGTGTKYQMYTLS